MRTNARGAAEKFQRIAEALLPEIVAGETAAAGELERAAHLLSSGGTSLETLRKAGHPFAKRAPQPALFPPEEINVQGGDFASGWDLKPAQTQGDLIISELGNVSPEAAFLEEGTPTMVARPVQQAILREAEDSIERHRQEALNRVLKA